MPNSMTGFQIIAGTGLQAGEGLAPPNITANLKAYENLVPVANYSNIYAFTPVYPGLTTANANLLLSLGSRSFPHVFGQIPNDFSSQLGVGPLFQITPARTAAWFGNSSTANVYVNVLGQAQNYAVTAKTVLSSAASSQWPGGPAASATGGFSAIAGNDLSDFQTVAQAIQQLGTLMVPSNPYNGFSNAGCFQRLLESGNDTIGNLHLTFFGQPIIDPTTGKTYIINNDLFNVVIDNPVGLTSSDPFKIAALNPLDSVIGEAANNALTQTGDLDAVVTYFGVGSNAASVIQQWTDCFNLPLMLGAASQIIGNVIGTSVTPYSFIHTLVNNVPGITTSPSLTTLGSTMAQIVPLTNSTELLALTAPVTQSGFSNLQAAFGPGSGVNGNPTVDDVLGSTSFNQAMYETIQGLLPLVNQPSYGNISSDTTKISTVLQSGFPLGGVVLSDGNTYTDINSLAVGGSAIVNLNAAILANVAATLSNVALFNTYNGIAETHNNSIAISSTGSSFNPIAVLPIVSNVLADFVQLSGLTGMIMSIIHRYYGASSIVKIDNPPQSAVFLKAPSGGDPLASFPQSLAASAALSSQIPNADEITGLNNMTNCFDTSTVTGQALHATVKEAQNSQVLAAAGLPLQATATNPISLATPKTGINTVGGLIS